LVTHLDKDHKRGILKEWCWNEQVNQYSFILFLIKTLLSKATHKWSQSQQIFAINFHSLQSNPKAWGNQRLSKELSQERYCSAPIFSFILKFDL